MTLPDFRIRFPAPKIDFDTEVGPTNTDIDDYPPPQGQARFDHMRLVLMGLLAQQASFSEPTIFADGTPWFDLNSFTLKISMNGAWVSYTQAIALEDDGAGNVVTLANWYDTVALAISSLAAEITFSGSSTTNGIVLIDIPTSLQSFLEDDSRALVYKNGLLLDPRIITIESGTTIRITGDTLDIGDTFTVFIRRIPTETFYSPSVTLP